jgi:phytoene synthase
VKGETTAPRLSPVGALVRRHDRDRYQTALFAPPARRDALFALYAFNYEIARVRESVREPMLGQIRLQWWREVVAAAYTGASPRAHVVAVPLTAAIREFALTRAPLDRMIDARERDLDDAPPATLAALEDYAEGTSAALVELALEALGAATPVALQAGRDIGLGYALAGLVRALLFHRAAGRSYIPVDIAGHVGLAAADYAAGQGGDALRAAVAEIAAAAARHLLAARRHRREVHRAALPALLPAIIAERFLARLRRAGYNPFDPRLAAPDPLQSWRLAAAALRRRF